MDAGNNAINDFGTKLKGGNLAVSDVLKNIIPDSLKIENVPLLGSVSAEGVATTINEDVYDVLSTLANLDVKSLVGAGTSFIGLGASSVDLAKNTANMVGQNPWTLPFMGLTGSIPLAGPFAAALGMPQTSQWLTQNGYGAEDVGSKETNSIVSDLPSMLITGNQPVVQSVNDVNTSTKAVYEAINLSNTSTIVALREVTNAIEASNTTNATEQKLASGGTIGGKSTTAIDDKLISGEEGEFVVRKDVAKKYAAQLQSLNTTGNWPKGYSIGGIIGNAKNIANLYVGSKEAYQVFRDTIIKDIIKNGESKGVIDVRFTKDATKTYRDETVNIIRKLPDDFKKALSASGKSLKFSPDLTFGGIYKQGSLFEQISIEGMIRFGKVFDKIFAKSGLISGKPGTSTVTHELTHSLYKAASPEARASYIAGISKLGYNVGTDIHSETAYLNRPTEIAAFSSSSIKRSASINSFKEAFSNAEKSIAGILNKKVTIRTPSIAPVTNAMDNVGKFIDGITSKVSSKFTSQLSKASNVFDNVGRKVSNYFKEIPVGTDYGLSKLFFFVGKYFLFLMSFGYRHIISLLS